ncbi:hypothetical protein PENTCL1PPCAC_18666, partial [Pristionchus entomophagus]
RGKASNKIKRIPSLNGLSPKLLRKIIHYTPESLLELRKTSQKLKECVRDYSIEPECDQIVDELRLTGKGRPGTVQLLLIVPMERAVLFDLRMQLIKCFLNKVKRVKYMEYQVVFDTHSLDANSLAKLSFLMGDKIGKVSLTERDDKSAMKTVFKLLTDIRFEQLTVVVEIMSDNYVDLLFRTIREHAVEEIALNVGRFDNYSLAQILPYLARLCRSIGLYQLPVERIDATSPYLMGDHNKDWEPVIMEMFSEKMDKLIIVNNYYPEYLWKKSAVRLLTNLPQMVRHEFDKNIWFDVNCNHYQGKEFKFENEEHIVQSEIF